MWYRYCWTKERGRTVTSIQKRLESMNQLSVFTGEWDTLLYNTYRRSATSLNAADLVLIVKSYRGTQGVKY